MSALTSVCALRKGRGARLGDPLLSGSLRAPGSPDFRRIPFLADRRIWLKMTWVVAQGLALETLPSGREVLRGGHRRQKRFPSAPGQHHLGRQRSTAENSDFFSTTFSQMIKILQGFIGYNMKIVHLWFMEITLKN